MSNTTSNTTNTSNTSNSDDFVLVPRLDPATAARGSAARRVTFSNASEWVLVEAEDDDNDHEDLPELVEDCSSDDSDDSDDEDVEPPAEPEDLPAGSPHFHVQSVGAMVPATALDAAALTAASFPNVPLSTLKIHPLRNLCTALGINNKKAANPNAHAVKAELLRRLRCDDALREHDDRLSAAVESANDTRARVRRENEDRLFDKTGNTGREAEVNITITRTQNLDVDLAVYHAYVDLMAQFCRSGIASRETAPNGGNHVHIQSHVIIHVEAITAKSIAVVKAYLRQQLNIPSGAHYNVSAVFIKSPRNGFPKGNQTHEMNVGYCLKENATDRFVSHALGYSPDFLKKCHIAYQSRSGAALVPGKVIYKKKLVELALQFASDNKINKLHLPMEIIVFLLLCDGYVFHRSWCATGNTDPYHSDQVNAVLAINGRPSYKAFDHRLAWAVVFGADFETQPSVSRRSRHGTGTGTVSVVANNRRRKHWTFGIYVWGDASVGKSTAIKKMFPHAGFANLNNNFYNGDLGQTVTIFDDQDLDEMDSSDVKKIFNHTAETMNVKGNSVPFVSSVVIIISNFPIEQWDIDSSARSRFEGHRGAIVHWVPVHTVPPTIQIPGTWPDVATLGIELPTATGVQIVPGLYDADADVEITIEIGGELKAGTFILMPTQTVDSARSRLRERHKEDVQRATAVPLPPAMPIGIRNPYIHVDRRGRVLRPNDSLAYWQDLQTAEEDGGTPLHDHAYGSEFCIEKYPSEVDPDNAINSDLPWEKIDFEDDRGGYVPDEDDFPEYRDRYRVRGAEKRQAERNRIGGYALDPATGLYRRTLAPRNTSSSASSRGSSSSGSSSSSSCSSSSSLSSSSSSGSSSSSSSSSSPSSSSIASMARARHNSEVRSQKIDEYFKKQIVCDEESDSEENDVNDIFNSKRKVTKPKPSRDALNDDSDEECVEDLPASQEQEPHEPYVNRSPKRRRNESKKRKHAPSTPTKHNTQSALRAKRTPNTRPVGKAKYLRNLKRKPDL